MPGTQIDLGEDLAALLQEEQLPLEKSARELIVLELYRLRRISSSRAAELLSVPLVSFIQRASQLGIPHFDMSADEWAQEREHLRKI